jgi:DNA-directed RNA polymerase subunit L
MDVGTLGNALTNIDITRVEVIEVAGYHLEHLIKKDTFSRYQISGSVSK